MSTPENQRLFTPLEKAADALEALTYPIRERIKNPDDWQDAHLRALADVLKEVTELEMKLRFIAGEVG